MFFRTGLHVLVTTEEVLPIKVAPENFSFSWISIVTELLLYH